MAYALVRSVGPPGQRWIENCMLEPIPRSCERLIKRRHDVRIEVAWLAASSDHLFGAIVRAHLEREPILLVERRDHNIVPLTAANDQDTFSRSVERYVRVRLLIETANEHLH